MKIALKSYKSEMLDTLDEHSWKRCNSTQLQGI